MALLFHRRTVLRLAAAGLLAGLGAACGAGSVGRPERETPASRRRLHASGRLHTPPRGEVAGDVPRGLLPLQLSGSSRDGLLYVPASYSPGSPAPLVLTLHGAGGSGHRSLPRLQPLADAAGLLLLAPDSRDRSWDVVLGGFGPDVEFVQRALDLVFARYAVDLARLVAEGFSDGASYALTLGLLNGDLFTHVIAFSPGFVAPGRRRGKPRVFVSHGVHDQVLPVELCSRRIVRDLRGDGYDVSYTEFDGGHAVPPGIAQAALAWMDGRG